MRLGWIWTSNLRPFLEILGRDVGYSVDEDDWAAFDAALKGSDSERGPWFVYPIGRVNVSVAFEPGADEMVTIEVSGVEEVHAERAAWLADLMRDYRVTR